MGNHGGDTGPLQGHDLNFWASLIHLLSLDITLSPRFPAEMQLGRNYHQRCHPPLVLMLKENMWQEPIFFHRSWWHCDKLQCWELIARRCLGPVLCDRCSIWSAGRWSEDFFYQQMIRRSIASCLRLATKANDKIPEAAVIFRQTGNGADNR